MREQVVPDFLRLNMSEFIQQVINGVSLGAIYALIALGYTMVYGILRFINFAHSIEARFNMWNIAPSTFRQQSSEVAKKQTVDLARFAPHATALTGLTRRKGWESTLQRAA